MVKSKIEGLHQATEAFTSLAVGADQIFARCALQADLMLRAVIPFSGYDRCFSGDGLRDYQYLLSKSEVVTLDYSGSDEESFYNAGRYIVDRCDLMFAIWDEQPSAGWGGTGDIVKYAENLTREIIIINPVAKIVKHRPGGSNG